MLDQKVLVYEISCKTEFLKITNTVILWHHAVFPFQFSFELRSQKSSFKTPSWFVFVYIGDTHITLLFFAKCMYHKDAKMKGRKSVFFSSIDKSQVHWVLQGNFDLQYFWFCCSLFILLQKAIGHEKTQGQCGGQWRVGRGVTWF